MTTSVSVHVHDVDQIECNHQLDPTKPGGYPVLYIHPAGDYSRGLSIFATRDRLGRLRDVISAYLAAHPAPDDDADARLDVDDLLCSLTEVP